MRFVFIISLVFINFILESTVVSSLEIGHIQPNTAIALIVSYAILRGSLEGSAIGFFAGLMQDIFFGTAIGYYAVIYMTIGCLCGIPAKNFFSDNFYLPFVLCLAGVLSGGIYVYVTSFLVRGKLDFLYYFNNIILPETVYTTVFSFFVYRLLFGINKKLEEYEHERRKVF